MKNSIRDKIRAATVGAEKTALSKIVEVGGQKIEVRQPTIKGREDLRLRSLVKDGDGTLDFVAYQIWCVILFSYVPDTNERVFEKTDYESLAGQISGSFVDTVYQTFDGLNTVDIQNEKKS